MFYIYVRAYLVSKTEEKDVIIFLIKLYFNSGLVCTGFV